jgi:hypothetical protein
MSDCIILSHRWPKKIREVLSKKLGRPVKDGYDACHTCDNGRCINPEHIYEGTRSQNLRDAHRRGQRTNYWGRNKGL